MTVRFSEEDPAITDEDAFIAEEPELTNAESNGFAQVVTTAVVVVEEDPNLLHRMSRALAKPLNTHSFSNLDQVGSARFPSGIPLVLVLGASQTDDVVLDKVGALLRGRPGTGAVLVLTQPSAEVLRAALRSGIDDAIETYDLERQLPQAVTELVHRLERELAAAAAEAARRAAPVGGKKGWVTTVFSPKGGVGKSVVSVNLATALARRTGNPPVACWTRAFWRRSSSTTKRATSGPSLPPQLRLRLNRSTRRACSECLGSFRRCSRTLSSTLLRI
jgi:hypothetical protein